MSPPSQEPHQPLTTNQIVAWMHRASLKRRHLLLYGTDPASDVREQAFQEMGELCLDALEEVRVISEQLWDTSDAARIRSAEIITESARLLAQYPSVTESLILQIFSGRKDTEKRQDSA